MDKNAKRKVGKLLIGVLAVILVSFLSIVSTIAYLSDTDGEEVHKFTLGEGVDIELIQDTAEPEEFYPEKEYSEKHASVKIPKDTAMEYEYVGVKVQYFMEKETQKNGTQILQFQEIAYSSSNADSFSDKYGKIFSDAKKTPFQENDVNQTKADLRSGTRNGWVEYNDSSKAKNGTVYLYYGLKEDGTTGTELAKVKHGSRLWIFDSIIINQDCKEKYAVSLLAGDTIDLYDQYENYYATRAISDDKLKGFRIVVTAYAVQGDIDAEEAKTSLVSLIENN